MDRKLTKIKAADQGMKLKRIVSAAAISAVLILVALPAQAGSKLYRYVNAQGRTEIANSIPNDRVKFGYEVLDRNSGRVISQIAAELSAEQVATRDRKAQVKSMCSEARKRVLSLYETPQDITYAEEKAIESIETRIINANANLTHLRNQQRQLEERAAQMERSGQALNNILVGNIERAKSQIENLTGEIEQRRQDQEDARAQYDVDRSVFNVKDCSKFDPEVLASAH